MNIETSCFDSDRFTKNQIDYYIKKRTSIFYIISNGETFGYISGIIDNRGKKKKARLYSLAILPKYRSKGFATLLLEKFEKEVYKKDCKLITLEVNKTNSNAFNLYLKQGYKYKGLKKDYYGINQDGITMHKNLK